MNNSCILYRHFKGGLYRIIHTGLRFNTADPHYKGLDGIECAMYVALADGTLHVRPTREFSEEVKNPNGDRLVTRFSPEWSDGFDV